MKFGNLFWEPIMSTARMRINFPTAFNQIALFLFAVVCFSLANPADSAAQKKYSPDHPDVKAMAWKAMESINSGRGGSGGINTLKALAILECYKRYEGYVPKESAAITSTVNSIAAEIRSNGGILDHHDLYYPCLATILLMEYDDEFFAPEIEKMLRMLEERQLPNGAYGYTDKKLPDTSQSQYVALVYFVARQHRFNFSADSAKRLLQAYVDFQADNGSWDYTPVKGTASAAHSLSIHSASISTVYLLADMLNLSPRKKSMTKALAKDDGLPASVTVYVPPKKGEDTSWRKSGPIVEFSQRDLSNCQREANTYYERTFQIPQGRWNEYYMYAFERYAFFREQADGHVGRNAMNKWYDMGVEYYKEKQKDSGKFPQGGVPNLPPDVTTSLAIMFLVRSSEIFDMPPTGSDLLGGEGFKENVEIFLDSGVVRSNEAQKSLSDLLSALQDESLSDEQLQTLTESMKRAIKEFKSDGNRSRAEIKAHLVNMIGAKNYFRRLVAIRLLAGEQDMDNVPALLYALGDPDIRIAQEAHDALRLVSRKIDSIQFVDEDDDSKNLMQMQSLKKKWTDWYVGIRPDADLID